MDIFLLNRLDISDEIYDALTAAEGTSTATSNNINYYASLSDWEKRKFRKLRNLLDLRDGKLYIEIKSKSANLRKKLVEVIAPRDRDAKLKALYENPETTKNGRDSFYHRILTLYANIPRRYVQRWLEKQENYQLHLLQT